MKIIVGLGNPGARFERTRHNAGYMVVDELARGLKAGAWTMRCQSLTCQAVAGGETIVLAKPLTFMNLSGHAVQLLAEETGVDKKEMILILDDLNLPLGKIRIRERGSAGGHRGLESVLRAIESEEIVRIRLGIGEENMPEEKAEFVLSEFPPDRMPEVGEMVPRAAQAVQMIISGGLCRAMAVFNT